MSRSASLRSHLPVLCTALLAMAASSDAGGQGPRETVAEVEAGPVVDAPVHDIGAPVREVDARVDDLTYATENEDGSLTDSENTEERVVTLAADVLFEFDEADLTGDARQTLAEAARILEEEAAGTTVEIDGYTDSKGPDSRNQQLSEERARTVEEELDTLVDDVGVTFEVEGHGSADPVAPNEIDGEDNPEGREKNRRVEIRFPH